MQYRAIYEQTWTQVDPGSWLHAELKKLRAAGVSKDLLIAELTDYMMELRALGDEPHEDLITDMLDFLTGWCSSHMRID